MPVTIEVYRGAGDHPGDPIEDALLGDSLDAALARGRAELNARAQPVIDTTLDLSAPRLDLLPGMLVEVSDPTQGAPWRGLIIGVRHGMDPPPTSLTLARIAE